VRDLTYVAVQEARTKVIEVDVVDASTLLRVLTYLYTGGYNDEKLPSVDYMELETDDAQSQSRGQASVTVPGILNGSSVRVDEGETQVDRVETVLSSPAFEVQITPSETETFLQGEQLDARVRVGTVDSHNCCTLRMNEPESVCINEKLQANTLVYILADYCQIPELKYLAVRKFAAGVEVICLTGFGNVCHLVYGSAPPTALDLRSCLSGAIASHGRQLVEDASIMSTVLLLPELLRDAFATAVREHHVACEERDSAAAASLEAKEIATEANTRAQEDKQRVVTQVNTARHCRHCGLDNNVFFERESSYLGRSEYSFRCRCRTRY